MELKDLWAIAKEIGPGGVVIIMYLYWRLQKKNDRMEDELKRLTLSSIKAINNSTSAISSLKNDYIQRLTDLKAAIRRQPTASAGRKAR